MKIIVSAAQVQLPTVEDDVFADVTSDVWYAPHSLYARNNNIIFPDEYGHLNADVDMTRAVFAEVVYRMMIVLDTGQPYPLDKDWDTYVSGILPFKIKYDSNTTQVTWSDNLGNQLKSEQLKYNGFGFLEQLIMQQQIFYPVETKLALQPNR